MTAAPQTPTDPPEPTAAADPIVGIDLGTTHSLVAFADAAGPRILVDPADANGSDDAPDPALLPSCVRYAPDGASVEAVGWPARHQAVKHPERTVYSIKRLMGRSTADLSDAERRALAYPVIEGPNDTARVRIGECVLSPPEVSAVLLRTLRKRAEAALGAPVKRAVVTVPAYFDDAQRQATRDAGRLAGLNVLRVVNEPTAAALAYDLGLSAGKAKPDSARPASGGGVSLNTKVNPQACATDARDSENVFGGAAGATRGASQTVAVYDLGGGTFDVSILRIEQTPDGVIDQVLATAGDTALGGDDVDRLLAEYAVQQAATQLDADTLASPAFRQSLRQQAEAAKVRLSQEGQTDLVLSLPGSSPEPVSIRVTRDKLEALLRPWIDRTLNHCRSCLTSAGLEVSDIDRVVLVGGSTRIPAVRRAVGDFFDREPYTALDPDRVVALGAAVQGSILAGLRRDRLLLDVTPLSLGMETLGGAMAKLIPANSAIPARAVETFTTSADHQTAVQVNVYQGERELVQDCRALGRFELKGLPPMPAGIPQVEVVFLIDANGVLTVSASEKRTGKAARIQVAPRHGLTREEVDRLEAESFAHAKQDMAAHRLVSLRNQAGLDLASIQKQIDRAADAWQGEPRDKLEAQIAEVQAHLDQTRGLGADAALGYDLDGFYQALQAMDTAAVPLMEAAVAATLRQQAAER
ncbi:MAG: Hsp70 family protein [Planctomycetota bacterium]